MNLNTLARLLLIPALAISAGCVKKRKTQFAQGQGVDAQEIQSIAGAKGTLTTGKPLSGSNRSSSETPLQVEENLGDTMNFFPLVEYTTDSELVGKDLPLRGRTNFRYELRHELTDSHLRVLKVGKKQDIPSEEWSYAVQLENDLIGVPLVGYYVRYFRVDHVQNQDNKKTSRLVELPVADRNGATHFRIDRTSRQIFQAVEKIDTYPAGYFKGEWYYQETVLATNLMHAVREEGFQGGIDTSFSPATRIRIDLSNNKALLGINLNRDVRISDSDKLNQREVFSIPIEWKSYRAEKNGRSEGLREEENREAKDVDRPYVKIQFEELTTPRDGMAALTSVFAKAFGRLTGSQRLVDLRFSRDYFSFTILNGGLGTKVRYFLLRIDPKKTLAEPRPYLDKDMRQFGYYFTRRDVEKDRTMIRRQDIESTYMVNRFNIQRKEIVYHFSKDTPKVGERYGWVREVAQQTINLWDQAFQMAGSPIRIRINPNEDVDLGDLRFNVLHIVNPLISNGSFLGYGPSLADSRNGEIISATMNINLSLFIDSMTRSIRLHIRKESGALDKNINSTPFETNTTVQSQSGAPTQLFSLDQDGPPILQVEVNKDGQVKQKAFERYQIDPRSGKATLVTTKGFLSETNQRFLEFLDGRGKPQSPLETLQRYRQVIAKPTGNEFLFRDQRSGITAGGENFTIQRIKNECPEIVPYIAKVKGDRKIDTKEELAAIEPCVDRLIAYPVHHTILHELGHNFGLRHNFGCSADGGAHGAPSNFWSVKDMHEKFRGLDNKPLPESLFPMGGEPASSCVMDYMSDSGPLLPVPGKYDIAAIRFGYADKVTGRDGQLISIRAKDNKGFTAIEDIQGELRKYKYCTDHNEGLQTDPMCQKFDAGSTPEEAVDNYINEFWNHWINYGYRYDRANIHKPYGKALAGEGNGPMDDFDLRTLLILKRYYDQWRFHVAEFVGQNDQYLERFDEKSYEEVLKKMSESSLKMEYNLYRPVRDKIKDFFIALSNLPNRYCISLTKTGRVSAIEFSKLHVELALIKQDAFAEDCENPDIQKLLAKRNLKYVTEIGHNLDTTYYSKAVDDLLEAPDTWGAKAHRLHAFLLLSQRTNGSLVHDTKAFFPSLLDEPDIRSEILSRQLERVTQGVDLSAHLAKIPALKDNPSIRSPLALFDSESDLLQAFWIFGRNGLLVPNKAEINSARVALFAVNRTRPGTDEYNAVRNQGAAFYPEPSGTVLFALPRNQLAYIYIRRIRDVKNEKTYAQSPVTFEKLRESLIKLASSLPKTKGELFSFKQLMLFVQPILETLGENSKAPPPLQAALALISEAHQELFMRLGGLEVLGNLMTVQTNVKKIEDALKDPSFPKEQREAAAEQQKRLLAQAEKLDKAAAATDVREKIQAFGMNLPTTQSEFMAYAEEVLTQLELRREQDLREFDAQADLIYNILKQ